MTGTDTIQQQQQRYPCPVCGNTFTRPQHVVRHLRSHTGERPYKCKECGDAFARSDLLSRHVNKCHPALANSGPPQNGKHPKRRACEHCAHTGSRCDSNSPCSSCVEQNVPCSRMPKAISSHHHQPPQHQIPPPLPGFSDPRTGLLPSLGSAIPNLGNTHHHRRNVSDTSASEWSSDSSRSRSSQYSQPGMGGGYSGGSYDSNPSAMDNLAGGGLSFRGSGMLPSSSSASASSSGLPWVPSSSSGNIGNLDQSTMTPSQVRAMYGGSLPAGYAHPSQYAASQLPGPPGSINLPNPTSSSGLNSLDPYNSYTPLVGTTYGGHNNNNNKGSSSGTSVGGLGQQNSSVAPAPAWKDYGAPQGATGNGGPNAYNYDPMADFTSQSVPGMSHGGYSMQETSQGSDEGHHSSNNSYHTHTSTSPHSHGMNNSTSSGSGGVPTRPSLPGLDSFMSATFPPLNNVTLSTSNLSNSHPGNPSPTVQTAPGMAYLYGRGGDRRGSVASSVDSTAPSDSVSTPSSLVYPHHAHGAGNEPPSPGGMSVASSSRPTTSSGSVILPNAFGSLHLRGGNDGSAQMQQQQSGDGEGVNPNASGQAGAGGETDNRKLRQLWSTWLSTPFSSSSEKDAFLMSNGGSGMLSPSNHPSGGGNSMASAIPSHVYSPTKQGALDQTPQPQGQGQQGPYSLQKSMSLPAIRTPSGERRSMADLPTPRVPGNQTYNLANAEELRRYQEACLARETPMTLAPPRPRNSSINNNNALTPPGTDSTNDGGSDGGYNSPSPGSIGTGSTGSGSVSGHQSNSLYVPSNTTSRPSSSHSTGSHGWQQQQQYHHGMSVPKPDPHVAKANMNPSGQLGGGAAGQYVSSSSQSGSGSRTRPSWKRLASQTIGPDLTKSARVDTDGDDTDGDGGFEIPRPPSLAGQRKRSNSSPTSNSTRPMMQNVNNSNSNQSAYYGGGGANVGFHALPSSVSPYPGAHGHHPTPAVAHN